YSMREADESNLSAQEQSNKQIEQPIVQSSPRTKKKRTRKRKKSKETVLSTLEQSGNEDIELQLPSTHHIDQLIKAEGGVEFNFSKTGTRVIQ
ncbi:MAG: hypothetical protein ACXAB7_14500, partial [Candidatus Kariarchaeaceae archaeon]